MADESSDAWRAVLLAEAAVSYAYSVSGPLLGEPVADEAATNYHDHERARNDALLALTATGAPTIPIPTFFELPADLDTPDQARSLLATVESRLALTYADLVAVLPASERGPAVDAVLLAATRAMRWGAAPGPWGPHEPAA